MAWPEGPRRRERTERSDEAEGRAPRSKPKGGRYQRAVVAQSAALARCEGRRPEAAKRQVPPGHRVTRQGASRDSMDKPQALSRRKTCLETVTRYDASRTGRPGAQAKPRTGSGRAGAASALRLLPWDTTGRDSPAHEWHAHPRSQQSRCALGWETQHHSFSGAFSTHVHSSPGPGPESMQLHSACPPRQLHKPLRKPFRRSFPLGLRDVRLPTTPLHHMAWIPYSQLYFWALSWPETHDVQPR